MRYRVCVKCSMGKEFLSIMRRFLTSQQRDNRRNLLENSGRHRNAKVRDQIKVSRRKNRRSSINNHSRAKRVLVE